MKADKMVVKLGLAIFVLLVILMMFLIIKPAHHPKLAGISKGKTSQSISEWRALQIGGIKQWLSIRGLADNPILLFLHGGPGTPETPFLIKYSRDFEKHFLVVSWEQRGAGKSYSSKIPAETMTVDQFVADTHEITQYLKTTFGQKKIYLMGHSWGTLIGIRAAYLYPGDYHAYIAIAQTSDGAREETLSYQKVLNQARESSHSKAIKELEQIGPPDNGKYRENEKALGIKLKWVRHFGGAAFHNAKSIWPLIADVLTTPVYSFMEKLSYPLGESFSLKHLYHEVRNIKLSNEITSLEVPIFFLHGRHDNQVPIEVARVFFNQVSAPVKAFHVFEESAHGVIFENPEKSYAIMLEIRKTTE